MEALIIEKFVSLAEVLLVTGVVALWFGISALVTLTDKERMRAAFR